MNFTSEQQIRLDVISKYLEGLICQQDAANALAISDRHFRRILKAFRENGIESLYHGNKGRRSPRKTPESITNEILRLYRGRYQGLNLLHFREKLIEDNCLSHIPSYETIRQLLKDHKVYSPRRKRTRRTHYRRKRYEREGIMIQIDGSHHRWLGTRTPFCLTAAIDDATGKIVGARFTEEETTFAAMDVVEQILVNHGKFQMLYSDKAGIYGGGKRQGYSNLNTALHELGILSINAHTPQAKGRVERLFDTLQDRLVSEMRLKGIRSLDEANEFLDEFIVYYNKRFSIAPKNPQSAFEPLALNYPTNQHMCFRDTRVVGNGEEISYGGHKIVLHHKLPSSLHRKTVEVRKYRDKSIRIFYQGDELDFDYLEYKSSRAAA